MDPTVADAAITPSVDATDPIVVAITWALTYALGRWAPGLNGKLRPVLPVVALLLAVGLRAGMDTAQGQAPATTGEWLAMLARGVAAGGAVVLAHSQVREVQKAVTGLSARRAFSAAEAAEQPDE